MRKKNDLVIYPGTDRKPVKALQVRRDMRSSREPEYQPSGPIHDQLKSPELIFGQPQVQRVAIVEPHKYLMGNGRSEDFVWQIVAGGLNGVESEIARTYDATNLGIEGKSFVEDDTQYSDLTR